MAVFDLYVVESIFRRLMGCIVEFQVKQLFHIQSRGTRSSKSFQCGFC